MLINTLAEGASIFQSIYIPGHSFCGWKSAIPAAALETPMTNVTLFGFPRSTFVKVVGMILTARNVDYRFHDTEDEMYLPIHRQRHPFGRVPALQHDDFMLYETNAIAAYVDDVFPGPKLTPEDAKKLMATQRNNRASE